MLEAEEKINRLRHKEKNVLAKIKFLIDMHLIYKLLE